jgi:hypothetical protein
MFDFINVFTEVAKKHEPSQSIKIEKSAGEFADILPKKQSFA